MRCSAPEEEGKYFGDLSKGCGEYRFSPSPSEQRPFKGFFQTWLKAFRFYVIYPWKCYVPASVTAYLIYKWANHYYARSLRKNPKDFENDV